MSDPNSSAVQEQRKAWQQRNSDQKRCMDEYGHLEPCYSPPAWEYTDVDLPDVGFSDAARTMTVVQADGSTSTIESEYDAHAVLHQHVFDPSLSDPDA
jgi:hypothetical protein